MLESNLENEKKSRLFIEKDTKDCPNCKVKIHKTSGCNRIICTNCNCWFCYLCFKVYKDKNKKEECSCTNSKGHSFYDNNDKEIKSLIN